MAEKSIIGIESVKMGACGANGTMGGTLTAIGLLVPGSVKMVWSETGKTELYVEGVDTPYVSFPDSKRERTVELETRDADPATLASIFGGSVAADKWSAPTSETPTEQSVELTSKSVGGYHYVVQIPRALVRASMDAPFSAEESANVKVVFDVLLPLDAVDAPLPPITIEKITE